MQKAAVSLQQTHLLARLGYDVRVTVAHLISSHTHSVKLSTEHLCLIGFVIITVSYIVDAVEVFVALFIVHVLTAGFDDFERIVFEKELHA